MRELRKPIPLFFLFLLLFSMGIVSARPAPTDDPATGIRKKVQAFLDQINRARLNRGPRNLSSPPAVAPGTALYQALASIGGRGLISNSDNETVQLLDPVNHTLSAPLLGGSFPSESAPWDVVVTPDGRTAAVAILGDGLGLIGFIDFTIPSAPVYLGEVPTTGMPIDLDLTPDGRYLLVSHFMSPEILAIDVATRTITDTVVIPDTFFFGNFAITAAGDGQTILTCALGGETEIVSRIDVCTLDPVTGTLTHQNTIPFQPGFFIVNLETSPDGQTVIGLGFPNQLLFFQVTGPGTVTPTGSWNPPQIGLNTIPIAAAFHPAGDRAYILVSSDTSSQIFTLTVTGPGTLTDSGQNIPLTEIRRGIQFFISFDLFAVEPGGRYAFSAHPVDSAPPSIAVIDLAARTQIGSIPAISETGGLTFPRNAFADLEVNKTVDNSSPYQDDFITYTIRVRNHGPLDLANGEIRDPLPDGLAYESHSATIGTYTPAEGAWYIPGLGVGAEARLTIRVKVTRIGTITNTAWVSWQNPADRYLNNNSSVVTIEALARPEFTDALTNFQSVDQVFARPGDTRTITIHYHNTGGPGTGFQITASPDPNLENLEPQSGATVSGGRIVWNVGPIAAGASGTVQYRARVKANVPTGVKLTNRAELDTAQTAPLPLNVAWITVLPSITR